MTLKDLFAELFVVFMSSIWSNKFVARLEVVAALEKLGELFEILKLALTDRPAQFIFHVTALISG